MKAAYLMSCPKCAGTGSVIDPRMQGQQMRELRVKKGIAVREVARRMNLSAPYISDIELGRRAFNTDLIQRYKQALNK